MKILILAFANYDNIISYAVHLGRNGLDVDLCFVLDGDRFASSTIDEDISDLKPGYFKDKESVSEYLPEPLKIFIGSSVNVQVIKAPAQKSIKKGLIGNYRFFKNIVNEIEDSHYDLIHFNGAGLFCYMLAKNIKNKPKVWTLHDYKPHTGEGTVVTQHLNRLTLRKMTAYIQHYKYLKIEFEKYFKVDAQRVFQVYSGTFDIFKHITPTESCDNEPYILWFGRISPYKGIEELIDAYKGVQGTNIPKLIIAGGGELWFEPEVNEGSNIIIRNRRLSANELVSLIKNSEFIVCPYKDATHSAVIMVSYTFNKPVLTTNVGGLSEVVVHKKTGYLAEKCDAEDIRQGLEYMINECDLTDMKHNIEELTSSGHLSWGRVSDQYRMIYQRIIELANGV